MIEALPIAPCCPDRKEGGTRGRCATSPSPLVHPAGVTDGIPGDRTDGSQDRDEKFIKCGTPEADPGPDPGPEHALHALIGRSVLQTRHRTRAVVQVGPGLCVHRCAQCRSACPKSIGRVAARNGGWRRNFSQLARPARIGPR